MLTGHTLSAGEGLSLHSGQSTYGDMNMHLGFITSIAKQQIFPPEYSILPGTKLAYPFLSDSISSSLYLFGTSLRVAYLVPMYAALAQVFFGMYAVAKTIYTNLGLSYRVNRFWPLPCSSSMADWDFTISSIKAWTVKTSDEFLPLFTKHLPTMYRPMFNGTMSSVIC